MGCFVKLLLAPKIDAFGLCLICFEFYSFHPGLESCMDLSMIAIMSSSDGDLLSLLVFVFSGLKVLLIEWSSVKPFRVLESSTILESVKAYQLKRYAP